MRFDTPDFGKIAIQDRLLLSAEYRYGTGQKKYRPDFSRTGIS